MDLMVHSTRSPEQLTSLCNVDCACADVEYAPVCGVDGVLYYSACHAGCVDGLSVGDNVRLYRDCACVDTGNTTLPTYDLGGEYY